MQNENIAVISTGAVLCIVMLTAFLIPIVSSATTTTDELTNEGIYFSKIEETHTIDFDYNDGDPIFKVDNIDMTASLIATEDENQTLAYGENFIVIYSESSNKINIYSDNETYPWILVNEGIITITPALLSFSGLNQNTTIETEQAITNVYMISTEPADYVYCSNPIIAEDTPISGAQVRYVTSNISLWRAIEGKINDLDVTAYSIVNGSQATVDSITPYVTLEDMPAYTNVDRLANLKVKTVISGGASDTLTWDYIVVPVSVIGERVNAPTDAEIAFIELIPLLFAVGLVLAVIAYAVRARLS